MRIVVRRVCVTTMFALICACTPVGYGGAPVVWPKAARLGDTVAMSIDSNYVPNLDGLAEKYDLSEDNVTVQITQGSTVLTTLAPRAVFDGLSAPASFKNATAPGPFMTVVVVDLPGSLPISLPATVQLRMLVDGAEPGVYVRGTLDLLGTGGSPTTFTTDSEPTGLGPRPMLRLQGRAAVNGAEGFDPEWEIGALEFTLEYPTAALSAPDVLPATEASRALAFTRTDDPPGSVHVIVTDPRGFTLPLSNLYPDGGRVGQGPLVDVVFEKTSGQGFESEDFTIRDLKVLSPDGELLTPVFATGTDTTAYFVRIARKNLAE